MHSSASGSLSMYAGQHVHDVHHRGFSCNLWIYHATRDSLNQSQAFGNHALHTAFFIVRAIVAKIHLDIYPAVRHI